jgi:hypothetical protein
LSLFRPKDSRYWWYAFYFDGERYRKSTKKTKKTAAAVVEASLLARFRKAMPSSWVERNLLFSETLQNGFWNGWTIRSS